MRFKDIQRAQSKVLAENRKGFNPFMRFGQILKDLQQCKMYATEDHVPEFSSSDEDVNFENLTPRSNEIYQVTKEIKKSFKENDQPPKTKISFYKVGKTIGKGAFGKVNLAMHILARKLVAIKTIKKEHTRKEENYRRLRNEVSILATLDSPYFIKLYDIFDDDIYTYLVTTL
jgi:ribosomal protein L21